MALPPAAAPSPAGPSPVPPPAIGAPMADAPMDAPEEDAGEPEVVATILKNADGSYTLMKGDEPEEDMEAAPGATPAEPTSEDFETPQALMRGLMTLLEGGSGAEEAFEGGFKGGRGSDMGAPPAGGPPKPPMGM